MHPREGYQDISEQLAKKTSQLDNTEAKYIKLIYTNDKLHREITELKNKVDKAEIDRQYLNIYANGVNVGGSNNTAVSMIPAHNQDELRKYQGY